MYQEMLLERTDNQLDNLEKNGKKCYNNNNNNNLCIYIAQMLYGYIQMHFTITMNQIREMQTASGAMCCRAVYNYECGYSICSVSLLCRGQSPSLRE